MKYGIKQAALVLCAAALLSTAACGKSGDTSQTTSSPAWESAGTQSSQSTTHRSQDTIKSSQSATRITLSGGTASVEGEGATAEGGVVAITSGGLYTVSGALEDGRVIVNAPGEEVTLTLEGADITCSYGSPLYIYKAGTATLRLGEGAENSLTDGSAYTYDDSYSSQAEDEPNACLYSKADLVIEGTGQLKVEANHDNGITSKDTLVISGSTLSVSAVGNGINGKDSNTIDSASITVSCGGDAIRSTNDTDSGLGWVNISRSTLELTAGEDGIQAETALTLSDGSYTITTGGGSGGEVSEDTGAKGIKAGTTLTLTGGDYTLNCADDAIHSNGEATVSGGNYTISTGDDALHAEEALKISDGEIQVLSSYEGLEGKTVELSGGTVRIQSSDDGVNAASGTEGGFGGSPDCHIDISGGCLVVEAGGDGLDSNGSITLSGGTVIVSSTGRADGALDYDGSFDLSGGTLLAVDGGGMPQAPSSASQYTVSLGFDSTLPEGTFVSLAGGEESFVFELPIAANHMVVSLPGLARGGEYTVSYGGDYSGETVDGICSGGVYSGGTELTKLTLEEYLTTYGSQGMEGMGGRPGGMMGGIPGEGWGGTPPEGAPDGRMPEDWQGPGERGGGPKPGEGPENSGSFPAAGREAADSCQPAGSS